MDWLNRFITPSRLDMFANYKSGYEYNFGDSYKEFETNCFIDKLLNIQNPDLFIKADAGTAIHKLFENSEYGFLQNSYKVNDWLINIPFDLNVEFYIPKLRELKVNCLISNINIFGRVDSIDAISVHDIKTTSSNINIDNYINSWQWKCYCVMTNLNKFTYDIFKVNILEKEKKVNILDYVNLELYSYSNMKNEVEQIILEYKKDLIILAPKIIKRISEYNNNIDILIKNLNDTLNWGCNLTKIINDSIKQINSKKIIIKGLNYVR